MDTYGRGSSIASGKTQQNIALDVDPPVVSFLKSMLIIGGPINAVVSGGGYICKHTLYAYAEGNDLHDVAETFDAKFSRLIAEGGWLCGLPWVVNQRRDDDPSLGPDDLPDWEVGLNLPLPDPGAKPLGWFADVDRIVAALERMHVATGRDFVLGIGHKGRGISEDVAFIGERPVDRAWLRRAFRVS